MPVLKVKYTIIHASVIYIVYMDSVIKNSAKNSFVFIASKFVKIQNLKMVIVLLCVNIGIPPRKGFY